MDYSFKDISSRLLKLLIVRCGVGPQPAVHEQLRKQGGVVSMELCRVCFLLALFFILHKTLLDS